MWSFCLSLVFVLFTPAKGCRTGDSFDPKIDLCGSEIITEIDIPDDFNLCDRRRLEAKYLLSGDETLWKDNRAKCYEEEYNIFLFIYHHLALVASPVNEDSDCHAVVFDVESDSKTLTTHKRVLFDKSMIEEDYETKSSLSKSIKKLKLKEIADAFEGLVEQGTVGEYDVMDNNCATYLMEAGKLLGISPAKNPGMVRFVKKRLLETGTYIMDSTRKHENVALLVGGTDNVEEITDSEIIDALVNYNIEKHDDSNQW